MSTSQILECSFLIPLHQDAEIADGDMHTPETWQWFYEELYDRFEGWTFTPGIYEGTWKSPKSGLPIQDQTRRIIVALPKERLDELRVLLQVACNHFDQQCIYLSIAGYVEFIEPGP